MPSEREQARAAHAADQASLGAPAGSAEAMLTSQEFTYLLNALECAAQAPNPFTAGYPQARREVFAYVAMLQRSHLTLQEARRVVNR